MQLECVIPFIIEVSGKIYSDTMDYINKIAKYIPGQKGDKKLENLRKIFLKQLNILIVKKNYAIVSCYNNYLSTINPTNSDSNFQSDDSRI